MAYVRLPSFGDDSSTVPAPASPPLVAHGEVGGIPISFLVVAALGAAAFAFGWFKTRKKS